MKTRKYYLLLTMVGLLFLLALSSRGYLAGQAPAAKPASRATFSFQRFTGNKPFKLNTLPTTQYGPPWADVVTNPANMVECTVNTAPIALCYYSGPGPTTPCTLDGLGIANCTCYEIPKGQPYQVDINAILNLDVYLKTVAVCGKDGSNCPPRGSRPAPVCHAINNNTFIPGADLISTFSLYLENQKATYPQFAINPTSCASSTYAGCMTAPCKRTGKTDPTTNLPLVQCGCPTFDGPYQVGQISTDQCVLSGNYVWSAAYAPKPTP
ncbi:MAG TPA: hypothetical protein VN643_05575 [Pyrinomonadaceae bacterium]|nr:hypothetical protein [Pyrinomonadaceae bacterium]